MRTLSSQMPSAHSAEAPATSRMKATRHMGRTGAEGFQVQVSLRLEPDGSKGSGHGDLRAPHLLRLRLRLPFGHWAFCLDLSGIQVHSSYPCWLRQGLQLKCSCTTGLSGMRSLKLRPHTGVSHSLVAQMHWSHVYTIHGSDPRWHSLPPPHCDVTAYHTRTYSTGAKPSTSPVA